MANPINPTLSSYCYFGTCAIGSSVDTYTGNKCLLTSDMKLHTLFDVTTKSNASIDYTAANGIIKVPTFARPSKIIYAPLKYKHFGNNIYECIVSIETDGRIKFLEDLRASGVPYTFYFSQFSYSLNEEYFG